MEYKHLVQDYIGEFGVFQLCVCALLALHWFTAGDSYSFNIVGGHQEHWCKVPELVEFPHSYQKYVAIPEDEDGYDKCYQYNLDYSNYSTNELWEWNRTSMSDNTTDVIKCSSWVYDQSRYVSTITSQWDLVCGKQWMISLGSTCFILGYMIGSLSSGYVSDRIGRKPSMMMFMVLKLVGNMVHTFSPNYILFLVGRIVAGIGLLGAWLCGYVLIMELVGMSQRPRIGACAFSVFSLGSIFNVFQGYLIRDHVKLQVAIAGINVVPFLFFFLLPESPRWLLVKRRYNKAERAIKKISEINGNASPEKLNLQAINLETSSSKHGGLIDLMRSRPLRFRSLVVNLAWITISLIWYGFDFNTGILTGNIYINTSVMAAMTIPACAICFFTMDWKFLGRRGTVAYALILSGIACLIRIPLILTDLDTAVTVLSMIGKLFIGISFASIYVFTAELFPTEIRNVGVGTASMFSRISGMAAPFVGGPLWLVWKPLPSMIFGILGTASGLLCLLLPETLNHPLYDTVAEVERSQRSNTKEVESMTANGAPTEIQNNTDDNIYVADENADLSPSRKYVEMKVMKG